MDVCLDILCPYLAKARCDVRYAIRLIDPGKWYPEANRITKANYAIRIDLEQFFNERENKTLIIRTRHVFDMRSCLKPVVNRILQCIGIFLFCFFPAFKSHLVDDMRI